MPPIIMSQISVVETSITPCIRPESISFSIDLPPMPVAWKTSGSQSFSISLLTCCTHVVVTPNIVMPTSGRSAAARRAGFGAFCSIQLRAIAAMA